MSVREDFITAYNEKWGCGTTYANHMLQHVELDYAANERELREKWAEKLRKPGYPARSTIEIHGENFSLTRENQRYRAFVELVSTTAEQLGNQLEAAQKRINELEKENAALRRAHESANVVGVREAAAIIGVTHQRVLHFASDGRLPVLAHLACGQIFWKSDVEAFATIPRRKGRPPIKREVTGD